MIEEKDYMVFESKIICAQCGNHFYLDNEDGKFILRCMGSYEYSEASCNAPIIMWDDLADAVNSVSTIVDLHLDFLWEAIDHVKIYGHSIVVAMEELDGETKSYFLRLQDYWLAHHSLQGDPKAKEVLYAIHAPLVKMRLHHLGYTYSLKHRDLEDLEQAIWLRTFRLLSSYNGQYRFWTWMRLLIRTEFHRSYVRRKKEITSDDTVRIQHETRAVHGKSNIDRWEDNEHVNELLSVLSDRERYVVIEYGTYLVPELVSEVDEQMLALMKKRDSLAEGDPQIEELNAQLQSIYESAEESNRHVYWRKPYAFYLFGGDVTDRLNEYMKNTSSNYADMHDRYWAENLADFYELVRNKGEMDLKNQPEWQSSAYIFDGEIVSQDALGNINYGYFGKHCNFPDPVLIAAGGVAQFLAGTSEFENWYVFLDDPRDTYRVMQGIEIYEEEN